MSLSVDTNIFVYALNRNSDVHASARTFLGILAARTDVVIAEQALVELYLLIRNPTVFPNPYPAAEAVRVCRDLRGNRTSPGLDSSGCSTHWRRTRRFFLMPRTQSRAPVTQKPAAPQASREPGQLRP